jgi:hypothetical protein
MNTPSDMIDVNVIVSLSPTALQAIVANAKALSTPDEKGHYHLDTADMVGQMISKFLEGHDFDAYVSDLANY